MTKRKDPADHKPDGRPTDYLVAYNKQVFKLCLLGAIDKELAEFFNIAESTLNLWKEKHPKFMEAIKNGRERADAEISSKLYHRAKGYEHKDTHFSAYEGKVTGTKYTKRYPPDPTSCIFWLKNRRRQNWRDQHEVTGKNDGPIQIQDMSDMDFVRRFAFLLQVAANRALEGNNLPPIEDA